MTDAAHRGPALAQVQSEVVGIFAAQTLYDPAQLLPDSHLQDELGIDSVLLQAILAVVQEHFGLTADLPEDLETIAQVAAAVEAATGAPLRPAGEPGVATAPDPLLEALVVTTMRHTEYPRERLDADADLQSELGIDSVLLTAVIADVAEDRGLPGVPSAAVTALTLRELRDILAGYEADVGRGTASS